MNGGAIAIGHPLGHERRAPHRDAAARAAPARRPVRCRDDVRRCRPGTGGPVRAMSAAERYLVLGLRLGKHVDGLVDAYYGPPELQEQVDAEETIDAAQLAADADALLAELEDGWLADQVHGCATYAHVLAGDAISYSDEVEGCYGVRPERVADSVYEEVHATARRAPARRRLAVRTAAGLARAPSLPRRQGGRRARRPAAGPAGLHGPAGRASGRRGADARAGPGRAVVGVQLLPGQPAQPGRPEHRHPDLRARSAAARRPRGLPRPPHRACAQGAAADARPGPHRGGDPARADAAGAAQRGHRRGGARRRSRRRGQGGGVRDHPAATASSSTTRSSSSGSPRRSRGWARSGSTPR